MPTQEKRIRIFEKKQISKKSLKCLKLKESAQPDTCKANLDSHSKNSKISAVQEFIEEPILLIFLNDLLLPPYIKKLKEYPQVCNKL